MCDVRMNKIMQMEVKGFRAHRDGGGILISGTKLYRMMWRKQKTSCVQQFCGKLVLTGKLKRRLFKPSITWCCYDNDSFI